MTDFTFSGVPLGSSVSVLVARGAESSSNSVATWGQGSTNLGTIEIDVTNHGALVAPGAVWLKAINPDGFNVSDPGGDAYDPSYHDITYVWTVRGQPIAPFSAPENMVDGWNNPNVMYGKHVAFYFPMADTYDVDLWCVDSQGVTAEATVQVEVAAPSYPGVNTIVVALDGDFAGAPTSSAQVTSIAALEASLLGRTDPTRISFKPGETHEDFRIDVSRGHVALVDTWTPGEKVNLNLGGGTGASRGFDNGFDDGLQTHLTFKDLRVDGEWDPTTETGETLNFCFHFARIPQRCDFMIADCEFRGMSFLSLTLRDYGGVTGCRLVMANSVVEDWQGYGIAHFANGDSRAFLALLGNRIKQDPSALGGGPKTSMQNDHGCVRIGNAQHVIVSQCDFFTAGGWSGSPPPANAALRIMSSVFPDSSSVVERNSVESGYVKIKMDGQNQGQAEYGGNHLVERNLLLGCARTFFFISIHYGGTTVRNNLCYQPDVPIFDNISGDFLSFEPDNPQASNQRPIQAYNNSFVSAETTSTRALFGGSGAPTYYSEYLYENNIFHALGSTSDGPLDLSTPIARHGGGTITPRFSTVQFNFRIYVASLSSLGGDVPNGGTLLIPFANFDRSTGFTHPVLVTGSTAPTDQAYWQAAAAAGDDLHMMRVGGAGVIHVSRGQFTVDYDSDPANVVITNTSGTAWTGTIELRLDRKSRLDIELPPVTSYQSPSTVPTCALLTAPTGETLGRLAHFDFFGAPRAQPVAPGAVEA